MRHVTYAFSEAPSVASRSSGPVGGRVKRAFDVTAALIGIAALAPVFLGCYLLVIANSGRPVLFGHRRIGFAGREFSCLKFRTMAPDAERRLLNYLAADPNAQQEWTLNHKLRNDPRITRVGRIMRRTSLDELPQLFNVLKGDMSLVGPRPIVVDEIEKYQEHYGLYASARPGLTGLWQVKGRNHTTYAQRVGYDVDYLQNWSLIRDIKIVCMTFTRVIDQKGAF
jgi:exopolysaccharide production protein ExoY